jgi:hypothetical protein
MGFGRDETDELVRAGEETAFLGDAVLDDKQLASRYWSLLKSDPDAAAWMNDLIRRDKEGNGSASATLSAFSRVSSLEQRRAHAHS